METTMTWENMPISSSRHHHHHRNPSFSSSLLDQIYRSIDDPPSKNHRNPSLLEDREISPDHKLVFHRRSIAADFDRSRRRTTSGTTVDSVFLRYSNSTSSDSSGFSSSESKSSASPPPPHTRHPKPIRTSSVDNNSGVQKPNSKQDLGGFLRTKSKALKIYTDLKKVKQPISPGGRLATFLNSLFTTNTTTNTKKPKKTQPQSAVSSTTTTTCSSASSFSRSCLSKTPSSSGKSKRSVRFCPVNVILDEEYSSSSVHGYSNNNHHRHVMEEENRRVIEAAKDLLRTYQKNKAVTTNVEEEEEEEEEDDDAVSCASSDLFELENLSAIGIERYREELPVYETTRLDNTNRAIAT